MLPFVLATAEQLGAIGAGRDYKRAPGRHAWARLHWVAVGQRHAMEQAILMNGAVAHARPFPAPRCAHVHGRDWRGTDVTLAVNARL